MCFFYTRINKEEFMQEIENKINPMAANIVSIDFETADYKADSACAIGMVRYENGKAVEYFSSLIRPPRQNFVFTYIHGIKWEDVVHEDDFAGIWERARDFLKDVDAFIAHNASFDRKVLHTCCIAHRQIIPQAPFYCTLKASRKFLKLPSHKLNAVAEHFSIPLQHHDAASDAFAAGEIFQKLQLLGHNVWECKCK